MIKELITMTQKAIYRLNVIQQVACKQLWYQRGDPPEK